MRALSRLPTISYACAPPFYPRVIKEIHISEDSMHVLKNCVEQKTKPGALPLLLSSQMDQGGQGNQVRPMKREINIYFGEYKIVISR